MNTDQDRHRQGPDIRRRHGSQRRHRGQSSDRAARRRRTVWLIACSAVAALVVIVGLGVSWWANPRLPRVFERWPAPAPSFTAWQERAPGLAYARANFEMPRPLKCHVLRIDLQNPELEVVVAARPVAVDLFESAWPGTLLRSEGLLAAVNATPFDPEPYLPGPLVKPSGVVVISGWAVSGPASNLDSLLQSKTGVWSMQLGQKEPDNMRLALGGFLVTLNAGVNRGEGHPQDAATTVGLSADRRWMYWLVVDGGQKGYSEGASSRETAEMLRGLGAQDVINLDGGGSTTMVVAGGWTGVQVLNRPRSPFYSGLQRPVACVLGVRRRAPGAVAADAASAPTKPGP